MNLNSESWSCARCGGVFIGSSPPEHGLCVECFADLGALAAGLAPIANQPCPLCGGPVCADCGQALITLIPLPPAGLRKPAGEEVTGHDHD
jgi:hypothetical protein